MSRPQATREHLVREIGTAAPYLGWCVVHFRPMQRRDGEWRTAIEGDAGYPDMVLARAGVTWHWECKGPGAYPTGDQLRWCAAIGDSAAVVRPCDWPWIVEQLQLRSVPGQLEPTLRFSAGGWVGQLAEWAEAKLPLPPRPVVDFEADADPDAVARMLGQLRRPSS